MSKYIEFADSSGSLSVKLPHHLFELMKQFCRVSPATETGGILVGKYTSDLKTAAIMHIEGPPKDSAFGSTWFVRGVKGLRKALESFWRTEKLYYLGEWHSHPFSSPSPSSTDHDFMKALKTHRSVDCKLPVLIIVGGDPAGEAKMSVTVYENGNPIALTESVR